MQPEALEHPEACPVKEDLRCQQITWTVERMGWVLMALIVLSALGGLFGGPTTRQDARDGSGRVQVSYQHYQRHLDSTEIKLSVAARGERFISVTIDRALADAYEIRSIAPAPAESQLHENGLVLRFSVAPRTRSAVDIVIFAAPKAPGGLSGGVGLVGEIPAHLEIFVYP